MSGENGKKEERLQEKREEITAVTERMLSLLEERQTLSREIGEIKKALGKSGRDPKREEELISTLAKDDAGKERFLRLLFELSLAEQKKPDTSSR